MGVTFGVEESTEGDVGVWGTKRKVLPNFHQISKYERLASAHPLRDFKKFSRIAGSFIFGQMLKFEEFRSRLSSFVGF